MIPNMELIPEKRSAVFDRVVADLARRIVGKESETEQLLIALLAQGHCLLEGVAGTGKSLLASHFSERLKLLHLRVSLTPDLEPTEVLQQLTATSNAAGTLLMQVLVADGIDQCSPKVQAQLMDTIRDREFRMGIQRHRFANPILVLACHNPQTPAHQPLSPSYSDQFLFQIPFRYPSYSDEFRLFHQPQADGGEKTVDDDWDLPGFRKQVSEMPIAAPLVHYALRLVRSTRVYEGEEHDFVLEFVSHGAGPRGVEALLTAARARAVIYGRSEPNVLDVKTLLHPVLRHRLTLNHHAMKNGVTPDHVIDRLLTETTQRVPGDESELPGIEAPRAV